MPRLCFRRRKLLAMGASVTALLVFAVFYVGTDETYVSSVDIPSDYELNGDATGKGGVGVQKLTLAKKPLALHSNGNSESEPDFKLVDRKPQAHSEDDYQQLHHGDGADAKKMLKFKFARDINKVQSNSKDNKDVLKIDANKDMDKNKLSSDEENENGKKADGDDDNDDDDADDDNDNNNNNKVNQYAQNGDEGYDYDNPPFQTGDFDYSLLKNYTKANTTALINEVIANTQEHKSRARSVPNLHMQASRLLYFVQEPGRFNDDDNDDNNNQGTKTSNFVSNGGHDSSKLTYINKLKSKIYSNNHQRLGKVSPTVTTMDEEKPATQIQMPSLLWRPGIVHSNQGQFPIVKDTIYWSEEVEKFVPKGISDGEVRSLVERVSKQHVAEMLPPLWNRCGRPKNQYIIMEDGTALCARYRDPHNKLIQGEVLSFYLARYLGLDNVPVVVVSQANSSASQWRGHDLAKVNWTQGKVTALIQWMSGLDSERSRVRMPSVILSCYEQGRPLTLRDAMLPYLTPEQLSELVQWTDMIVFDYITGHYDRVASMQDGAEREKRPSVMSESIRNLRQTPRNGKIWLIDNESGLFDAYELMYRGKAMGQHFIEFHRLMLRTICLFRRELVDKVDRLVKEQNPEQLLVEFANFQDRSYHVLPKTPQYALFKKYFHKRLKDVHEWMQSCKTR